MTPGVVVVGSSNADLVARVPRAPRGGETVLCDTYEVIAGGKGANQAVAAARMGAKVTFVACVGDDPLGRQAVEGFRKDGIDTGQVRLLPDAPTGTAFIWVEPSGENRIVVASGANGKLTPERVDAAGSTIRSARVLLCQLETPLPSVRRALELAREAGVTTILNPAPAANLDDELLAQVDILTPNEGEAAQLAGGSEGQNEANARRLLDRGVGAVCLTLGERGVLVLQKNRPAEILPAPKVTVVDTTAAGDTFSGALAAFLAESMNLVDAARLAVRAASLTCTRPGAQPSIPHRAELDAPG